ncbi:hypothetical protein ACVIRO_007643 [Rhizobium ruizarguesonis]
MTEGVLVDNDVVVKICAYRCGREFLEIASFSDRSPSILAVARHSISSRLGRSRTLADQRGAKTEWEGLVSRLTIIEPSPDEVDLAADFETRAIELSLQLDTGESQLFAILVSRSAPLLLTGDKRAIQALEEIAPSSSHGTVGCLEQLLLAFLNAFDNPTIRSRICAEPSADRAATICFSCSSPSVQAATIVAGLKSYIANLRAMTPRLLVAADDLSAIVP